MGLSAFDNVILRTESEESLTLRSFADGAHIKLAPAQDDVRNSLSKGEGRVRGQSSSERHSEGAARRISHNERWQEKIPSTFGRGWHEVSGEGLKCNNQHPSHPSLIREGVSYPLSLWVRGQAAFTLTEVLLAIVIVGVIAALVLPAMVTHFQERGFDQAYVRETKTIESAIQGLAVNENKSSFFDTMMYTATEPETYSDTAEKFLKKYLRVSKICGDNNGDCFGKTYYQYVDNDKKVYTPEFKGSCASLKNGASICLTPQVGAVSITGIIDVNGQKGPNVFGKDLRTFSFSTITQAGRNIEVAAVLDTEFSPIVTDEGYKGEESCSYSDPSDSSRCCDTATISSSSDTCCTITEIKSSRTECTDIIIYPPAILDNRCEDDIIAYKNSKLGLRKTNYTGVWCTQLGKSGIPGDYTNQIHYACNGRTGKLVEIPDLYFITSNATDSAGNKILNEELQTDVQGYSFTSEEGIYEKEGKYYTYDSTTGDFVLSDKY